MAKCRLNQSRLISPTAPTLSSTTAVIGITTKDDSPRPRPPHRPRDGVDEGNRINVHVSCETGVSLVVD